MTDSYKSALRASLKQTRKRLSPDFLNESSRAICTKIQELRAYQEAKSVALYQAIHGEVILEPLWHAASQQNKSCCFPVLTADKTLAFLPAKPESPFHKNKYHILEPTAPLAHATPITELDIMFLPLVAFDKQGTRLGMGSGYYDRTLQALRPKLMIGVGYEFQRQFFLVRESWDIPLDAIVTEQHLYWRTT